MCVLHDISYLVESVDITNGNQKCETGAYCGYGIGGILLVAKAIKCMLEYGISVNSGGVE